MVRAFYLLAALALASQASAQRPARTSASRSRGRSSAPGYRVTWSAVSAGSAFTCGLDQTGRAYCWGENANHKLGISDSVNVRRPRAIETPQHFSSIATGVLDACGVSTDGSLVCWGGSEQQGTLPRSVFGEMRFRQVGLASGGCGLDLESKAYCWGPNGVGQLGSGRSSVQPSTGAERVAGNKNWASVAVAGGYRCAVAQDGSAYCWGGAMAGSHNSPNRISGGRNFQSLAVGEHHTCGLTKDGQALCWGEETAIGTGSTHRENDPTPVAGGHRFKAITAGYDFTCALDTDGKAWCWGHNEFGVVGNGSTRTAPLPAQVSGNHTYSAISAGPSHVCAIATDGTLWCWGDNGDGELGIASSQSCRRLLGPGQSETRPCAMVPTKVQDPR